MKGNSIDFFCCITFIELGGYNVTSKGHSTGAGI